jgi:hypothetical protein
MKKEYVLALIGAAAVVIAALIAIDAQSRPVLISIAATQTAEAKATASSKAIPGSTAESTLAPSATQSALAPVSPTQTAPAATILPTFTDAPQPSIATTASDSVTPAPSTREILVNQPFEASVSGLLATLKSIEILPTGATRWHFEFWNKSNNTIRIRPRNESYVVDDQGYRSALLSGFEQQIQPGVLAEVSADFDTLKPGAQVFTLYLINYYADVNFKQPTLSLPVTLQ